jgi:hypothetical protein
MYVDLVAGGFCFLYCLCQILLLASCTFYRVSNSIALLVHRILLYNIVLLLIKMSVFFIKKKHLAYFVSPLLILLGRILILLTYAKILCIELNQGLILQLMQKPASYVDVNQLSIELY